jgi:enoyl-CoA hydratase
MSVRVDKAGVVWTVTIDRAERRNAVDRETAQALADAFRAFEDDAEARVGVLYGDHGTFCAGADLRAFAEGEGNRLDPLGDGPMGPSRMVLSKPVVAAIAGYAVAGGLELALWCDLRVAEEGAVLGVLCRRWGVPLIDPGAAPPPPPAPPPPRPPPPVRLPRLIGLSRALDLILTGRAVGAQEALAMGLVNRVVRDGEALAAAQALAADLARFPQKCLRADRRSAYDCAGLSLEEGLRVEFANAQEVLVEEARAGAARFTQGRGRGGRFDDLG